MLLQLQDEFKDLARSITCVVDLEYDLERQRGGNKEVVDLPRRIFISSLFQLSRSDSKLNMFPV